MYFGELMKYIAFISDEDVLATIGSLGLKFISKARAFIYYHS